MSKQPETLRLIGQLDEIATYSSKSATWALDAVNELEQLYALNKELVNALREIEWTDNFQWAKDRARAALAKARGEA